MKFDGFGKTVLRLLIDMVTWVWTKCFGPEAQPPKVGQTDTHKERKTNKNTEHIVNKIRIKPHIDFKVKPPVDFEVKFHIFITHIHF